MPKETMGHNWILFRKMSEGELNILAMDAAQNPPDYLPRDRSGILAKTRMLGPGEHDVITVSAPSEPGKYVYACTFPPIAGVSPRLLEFEVFHNVHPFRLSIFGDG